MRRAKRGADGVVSSEQLFAELTTPARQLLLSCRATPPLRGGECPTASVMASRRRLLSAPDNTLALRARARGRYR